MTRYCLAYLGAFLLRPHRWVLFAYALIFASFSHLRFIQNLTGRGDELLLAQQWFGIAATRRHGARSHHQLLTVS